MRLKPEYCYEASWYVASETYMEAKDKSLREEASPWEENETDVD